MEVGEVVEISWWVKEAHEVAAHLDFSEVMIMVRGQINPGASG